VPSYIISKNTTGTYTGDYSGIDGLQIRGRDGQTTNNFDGDGQGMRVASWDLSVNDFRNSLIAIPLSALPSGETIDDATLYLYQNYFVDFGAAGAATIKLRQLNVSFDQATATWATRDGSTAWATAGAGYSATDADISGTNEATYAPVSANDGSYISFTLTAAQISYLQTQYNASGIAYFVLTTADLTTRTEEIEFQAGWETDGQRPALVVNTTVPYDAGSARPLDDYSATAEALYSFRQLRRTAEFSFEAKRLSDNALQDIGFDGSGDLDTTALLAFAGANSVSVNVWYEQNGSGNDLTASNDDALIVNAGTLQTYGTNSRAGLRYPSSNDEGMINTTVEWMYAAASCLSLHATVMEDRSGWQAVIGQRDSGDNDGYTIADSNGSGVYNVLLPGESSDEFTPTLDITDDVIEITTFYTSAGYTGTALTLTGNVDGGSLSTITKATSRNYTGIQIAKGGNDTRWRGLHLEHIILNEDDTDRTALTNNLIAYYQGAGTTYATDTADITYTIRNFETDTADITYDIRNFETDSVDVTYDIRNFETDTVDVTYDIRNFETDTVDVTYSVLNYVSETKDLSYLIRNYSAQQFDITYEILEAGLVSTTKDLSYSIRNFESETKDVVYTIRNYLVETKDLSYSILAYQSETFDIRYLIEEAGLVSASINISYDIRNYSTETKEVTYSLYGFSTTTKDLIYDILEYVGTNFDLSYSLRAYALETKDLTYAIFNYTQETKDLSYQIRNFAEETKDLSYGISNYVLDAFIITYDIGLINRVSTTRQLSYNIYNFITSEFDLSYSIIRASVLPPRTGNFSPKKENSNRIGTETERTRYADKDRRR
jgi:hypothetical protein